MGILLSLSSFQLETEGKLNIFWTEKTSLSGLTSDLKNQASLKCMDAALHFFQKLVIMQR